MTCVAGVRLAEPAGLRAELLALAPSPPAIAARAGEVLVGEWAGELADAGVSPDTFYTATSGFARELWLWVAGERRWQPTAESLFARAVRRAGA
jgi:hypothetical protein